MKKIAFAVVSAPLLGATSLCNRVISELGSLNRGIALVSPLRLMQSTVPEMRSIIGTPDEFVHNLVKEALPTTDADVILDGCPTTVSQARLLHGTLQARGFVVQVIWLTTRKVGEVQAARGAGVDIEKRMRAYFEEVAPAFRWLEKKTGNRHFPIEADQTLDGVVKDACRYIRVHQHSLNLNRTYSVASSE